MPVVLSLLFEDVPTRLRFFINLPQVESEIRQVDHSKSFVPYIVIMCSRCSFRRVLTVR
jgi:hypothetical protein